MPNTGTAEETDAKGSSEEAEETAEDRKKQKKPAKVVFLTGFYSCGRRGRRNYVTSESL
jgi:hypothetical protein